MHILAQLKDAFLRLVRQKTASTISAFRKLHLAKIFFIELGFSQRGVAKTGGCNYRSAKTDTGKIKAGKIQISQVFHLFYHQATL
jgi:hypothetical protein